MILAIANQLDDWMRTWGSHLHWPVEHVVRLLVAAGCGALVGMERELRGRQAGFRTNLLVALGSALVMIVSISFAERSWPHDPGVNLTVDPARVAYSIMAGIGFLGAGTILKNGANVRGLTTAAGLWCVAAIGMAAGFGMYTLTLITTAIVVAALWILGYFEDLLPKQRFRTVVIRRDWGPGCVVQTVQHVQRMGLRVNEATFQRSDDLRHVDISVRVAFSSRRAYFKLERELVDDPIYHLLATREE